MTAALDAKLTELEREHNHGKPFHDPASFTGGGAVTGPMTRLQVAEIPAILVVHDPDSVVLLVGRSTSLPWWKVAPARTRATRWGARAIGDIESWTYQPASWSRCQARR